MGVDIYHENERGEKKSIINDPKGLMFGFIEDNETFVNAKTKLLKYVDPWGDAVFNELQMEDLIQDLSLAQGQTKDEQTKNFFSHIIETAKNVKTHEYLRFCGD